MKVFKILELITKKLGKFSQRQLISLAAFISIIFTGVLYFYISGITQEAKDVQQVKLVQVLTANQDIPSHTVIRADMLKITKVPQEVAPANPIDNMKEAVGKISKVPIMASDIVTVPKLFASNDMAGFTGIIPKEYRAMSIKVSDVTGVAGFAMPGDRVDVVLVTAPSDNSKITGKLIMQDILLLGMNKESIMKNTGSTVEEKSQVKKDETIKEKIATATLAVKPYDALRLAVAQQQGTLFLELRPLRPAEEFVADTDYTEYKDIAQINKTVQSVPAANMPSTTPYVSAPSQYNSAVNNSNNNYVPAYDSGITVIRGTTKNKVEVR